MRKLALHWQILIAIILAFIVGLWMFGVKEATGNQPAFFGLEVLAVLKFIGKMFLNALKMIIVPLIMSSIIVGVAGIGSGGNLGALGGKTLLFYATTTLAAILVGMFVINAIGPGYIDGEPAKEALSLTASVEDVQAKVGDKGVSDVAEIFIRMFPPNIVKAAAEGQMLGLIVFAILFGYFMTHLAHDFAEPLFKFWNGVFHVMMKMTEFIMAFAPIGIGRRRDSGSRAQSDRAAGPVRNSRVAGAGDSRIRHIAIFAAICRQGETAQDTGRCLSGYADRVLDRIVIGDITHHDGKRRR